MISGDVRASHSGRRESSSGSCADTGAAWAVAGHGVMAPALRLLDEEDDDDDDDEEDDEEEDDEGGDGSAGPATAAHAARPQPVTASAYAATNLRQGSLDASRCRLSRVDSTRTTACSTARPCWKTTGKRALGPLCRSSIALHSATAVVSAVCSAGMPSATSGSSVSLNHASNVCRYDAVMPVFSSVWAAHELS